MESDRGRGRGRGAVGRMLCALALGAMLVSGAPRAGAAQEAAGSGTELDGGWTKERKAVWLNLAVGAAAIGWGTWSWDWGALSPGFQDEGWFGRDTTEGGADKLGHFWSSYALSHLFAGQYRRWDFDDASAARLGALSSLGVMTLIEVGDAFSDEYGFSYQDALFNTAGAAVGYLLWSNPRLAEKIDFRVEYDPFRGGRHKFDVFTDYDRLKYLVAVKADGFEALRERPILRLLELHFGFYARNYDDPVDLGVDRRERNLYAGIGLNVTRLLRPYWDTGIFDYLQVPYTYIPLERRID